MPTDFNVNNQGTIFLLTPLSEAAMDWVEEHLPSVRQTWGPSVVVEHRYIGAIVEDIRAVGLEVEEV